MLTLQYMYDIIFKEMLTLQYMYMYDLFTEMLIDMIKKCWH
jgi:hypothetical protein